MEGRIEEAGGRREMREKISEKEDESRVKRESIREKIEET